MRAKGDEKERGRRESKRDKERQIERKEKVEAPEERQRERKKKSWNCNASRTMANVFNCLLSPARFVIIKVVFMGDLGQIKNTLARRSDAEMDAKAIKQTNPHRSCSTGCFIDGLLL